MDDPVLKEVYMPAPEWAKLPEAIKQEKLAVLRSYHAGGLNWAALTTELEVTDTACFFLNKLAAMQQQHWQSD